MNFHERYLEDLSDRDKYIINARDVANKTFKEIANELGISQTHVSNLYKMIKKDEEIYKDLDATPNDLDKTIHFLGLSSSINNALKRANIYTISDLKQAFESERIYSFRCIGPKSLELIRESLINKLPYDKEFIKYVDRYHCSINDCIESKNGTQYFIITIEDYVLNSNYQCIVEIENGSVLKFFFENGRHYISKILIKSINESIIKYQGDD